MNITGYTFEYVGQLTLSQTFKSLYSTKYKDIDIFECLEQNIDDGKEISSVFYVQYPVGKTYKTFEKALKKAKKIYKERNGKHCDKRNKKISNR